MGRPARNKYKLTIQRVARSHLSGITIQRVARSHLSRITIQRVARSHLSGITIQRVAQVDIQTRRKKTLPHHGKAAAQGIREIQGPNIKTQGPQQMRINTQIVSYLRIYSYLEIRGPVLLYYKTMEKTCFEKTCFEKTCILREQIHGQSILKSNTHALALQWEFHEKREK